MNGYITYMNGWTDKYMDGLIQTVKNDSYLVKQDTKIDAKIDSVPAGTKTTDNSATSSESGGKIMFKKPTKRTSTEAAATTGPLYSSSSKRKTKSEEENKKKKKGSGTGIKNSKLLSFDDNDEDEER